MHEVHAPFDGQEVLAQFDAGNIADDWRVFCTSRRKLKILIFNFCAIVGLMTGFLETYLLVNFDHHPPVSTKDLFITTVMVIIFIVIALLISLSIWVSMKDIVYIFTPNGLVRRNHKKQKKIFAVNYWDIVGIYNGGDLVIVETAGKRQKKSLHCQLLEPPVDEAFFTFEKMYEAFKTSKPALTLSSEGQSAQNEPTDEAKTGKIQPPSSKRAALGMLIGFFCVGFILYFAADAYISFRHAPLPSSLIGWLAWIIASIMIFLWAEELLLLLSLLLRKIAEQISKDERLYAEPETIESRRLVRKFTNLWTVAFFLSHPAFTSLAPIVITTLFRPSLQILLLKQMQAAGHTNYGALLVLVLLWLLCCLTFIPLVQVWRGYLNTAHSTSDEEDEARA